MGGVKIGAEVDIQRSNGRIHSAVVSGVNCDTLSVTVEWFERGVDPTSPLSNIVKRTTSKEEYGDSRAGLGKENCGRSPANQC